MSKGPKYPNAAVIPYGPNDQLATKLVVSIFTEPGPGGPQAMNKWCSADGDVRDDSKIANEVTEFIRRHGVKETMTPERIFGCPHEEGIDYPERGVCPQCPFWANWDRFSGLPIPLTVDEVLAELRDDHSEPPVHAFTGADRLRAELVDPLLEALDRGIAAPKTASDDEASLFSYAIYLLASWRERRAYPFILRWLSLRGEGAFEIGGDIVTQDGSRILASVCDGDLEPVKAIIEDRAANQWARGAAIETLAILVAWQEIPRETLVEYFRFLVTSGLERIPSEPWWSLASACIDIGADELQPELTRAFNDELIDPIYMKLQEFNGELQDPVAERIAQFTRRHGLINDVAAAISWWGTFRDENDDAEPVPEPYIAPPKIGRNDQCPCGSGKKYKKCCGQTLN